MSTNDRILQLADAGDRLITKGIEKASEKLLPQSPEAIEKRRKRVLKPLAWTAGILVAAGGAVGLGYLAGNAFDSMTEYLQQQGEQMQKDLEQQQRENDMENGTFQLDMPPALDAPADSETK